MKTPDCSEVGYGKPPKHTQFPKGVSGNPKGRPKKAPNFDHELIRESKSSITINDNGRRSRISKHSGVIKQLINKALTGNISAARTYLGLRQQALERAALSAAHQCSDPESEIYKEANNLTDEELMRIVVAGQKKTKHESGMGHVSNTD